MTDTHAASELKLYIDNDGDLYRRQTTSILKNLATKKARGVYKHDLAVKLFGYLVQAGAKKYADEFEPTLRVWHQIFDAPTRRAVAEALTRDFEGEYALGNYDSLLPKKYQPAKVTTHHARIKSSSSKTKWKVPQGIVVRWAPVNSAWFALWPASAPLTKQQVLKIAGTEDMHGWLRDTYGAPYGLAARATAAHARRKSSAQLERDIAQVLSHRGGR